MRIPVVTGSGLTFEMPADNAITSIPSGCFYANLREIYGFQLCGGQPTWPEHKAPDRAIKGYSDITL
jgi:hypothetical protein